MIVRPYRPQDQGELATLWYESWHSTGLERPLVTWQALADRIASEVEERWEVVVAERDGRLIAFLALAPSENRLDQLFVSPDAQGRRIGVHLLDLAKQRFPQGFWLSTQPENVRARAFYEHNGLTLDHARSKLDDERVIYVFAGARR